MKGTELFPHSNFGYRLEFKDGAENKICWFCNSAHIIKYMEKYKVDTKNSKIDIHPDYPPLVAVEEKKKVRKSKQLFADLDTYVKITEDKPKQRSRKAPPAAPTTARKTPKATPKGKTTEECPKLLSDRFKAKKK
jgi:hypothetical protein